MMDFLKRLLVEHLPLVVLAVFFGTLGVVVMLGPKPPPIPPQAGHVDRRRSEVHHGRHHVSHQGSMPMMWLVKDLDRWGYSLNVVRAPTEEEALKLARPNGIQHPSLVEVIPLPMEGEPAILWCHEESPDSPREG